MGAAGNKKPKMKTAKHNKHIPAYEVEEKSADDLKKK